jgi:lysophospholipid acyltransferase (LPLAT)-like uncharacterized protein
LILYIAFGILKLTLRYNISSELKKNNFEEGGVFTFWHGKMLVGWDIASRLLNNPHAVVSPSNDGKILAGFLRKKRFNIIHGSSNKSSKETLSAIVHKLSNSHTVVMTPDGPRGPHQIAKPGAVVSALRSSSELYAVKIIYSNSWKLGSWDSFEIPKPFSRVDISLIDIKLDYSKSSDREQVKAYIDDLTKKLGR